MALPKGWAECEIADIAADDRSAITDGPFGSALKTSHYTSSGIKVIRLGNIGLRRFLPNEDVYIDESRLQELEKHQAKSGDLVTAALGEPLGRTCLVPEGYGPAIVKADCYRLRAASEVDGNLLLYWLNSPKVLQSFLDRSQGIGRVRINLGTFRTTSIPLPPAAEQRRIVAKLDALTVRIARARAELNRVAVLAANLRFAAMRGAYQIASAYRISELADLLETLDQGWSPKCENYPSSNDNEWAVLKTTAIQAMAYRSGENKVLPPDLQPRAHIEIRAGDILVTRAGPRVRCGVTCLVETTRPRLMLADKMYRLRCKRHASPDFLAFMLNSPQALERIEAMKTGISDSGLNLTQGKFLALELPAPSIEVQNQIVDGLRTAFARADHMEAEAARARKLLDRLESAILAKAFRGELVPQDPDDEPASVLLERIRAERAGAPKRGRRKADP
ncbi:restriction endonuclease subunit S [Aurantimonas coralicida]|uniref:restriction endonuclease subunit S n=1 Tax=Aurantimonas coralicida TaxID=182270 RepID=UPI001E5156AA|nr:restriction endonuclease subunit S [Aurantimonas coralicida]MCD1645314.1 restriction endonuclease subunit S [Aurantimonas coralicida]